MNSRRYSAKAAVLIMAFREDLCLSYANTLSWRGSDAPAEKLAGFAELLSWLISSAGLSPEAIEEARNWSRDHPEKAVKLFAEAIAMREAIFRTFSALASGNPVRDQDFAALNRALAGAPRAVDWRAWTAATLGGSSLPEYQLRRFWRLFCGRPETS